ncbi:hypothetical protein M011DRAFT_415115 [Sporormia fimetaria CBS 119925]|uniref:SMP-LTD domain-containing protein n=1 Tax=Sporormia fimetaria CBS 119925 TaxID=1340428 RepID=A0A6A6VQE1_9PLEO|nr:hypothetical protein M011DRAFT_415115 [Sporormia fimetaria CBS 119925]
MTWSGFLAVYLLGGVTFIPLTLGLLFLHAFITQPVAGTKAEVQGKAGDKSYPDGSKNSDFDDAAFDGLPQELKTQAHVPAVAAGYFAVCREYVPGGINGKPPERTTPAGSVVATESPSVYQSMYRSIFDRNKTTSPSLDANAGKSKKARNVFYVVLRLGILMLYDDSEQLEVRHVISLAHYDVDIYGGGDPIPEGELWIKRNCIRLVQRSQPDKEPSDAKPFYLFSDNCSEKEDFYHAILKTYEERPDAPCTPPHPLKFDTADLVRLVQQLHASEDSLHTRWLNALIGRVFLAMYKTEQIEQYIWNKITKKISRVPKPALISKINLQKVDMGHLPPFITNPRMRDLTVDGLLTLEADVSYKGNFRVEISAIARIELGSRFKPREVSLVLATTLKKLEGHILIKIKPPPSNRLWISFATAPKMELSVEPIVSSRQITYGVILRAIESRLREVISETLVLPNWDDIPFKATEESLFRGGIWESDAKKERDTDPIKAIIEQESQLAEKDAESDDSDEKVLTPASTETNKSNTATLPTVESPVPQSPISSSKSTVKPKAMRSSSFASVAGPIVSTNEANASSSKKEQKDRVKDAAASMKTITMSQPTSPPETPVGSPSQPSLMHAFEGQRSTSPVPSERRKNEDEQDTDSIDTHGSDRPYLAPEAAQSQTSVSQSKSKQASSTSLARSATTSSDKRQLFNQSLNTATQAAQAAKKWFTKQNQNSPASPNPRTGSASTHEAPNPGATSSHVDTDNTDHKNDQLSTLSLSSKSEITAPLGSPANPIGRGQLIPETILHHGPKTDKKSTGWSVPSAATIANLTRRKPVPPTGAKQAHAKTPSISETSSAIHEEVSSPPPRTPTTASTSTTSSTATMPSSSSQFPQTSKRPGHERKASVGTAAMGVRRKSSAVASSMVSPSSTGSHPHAHGHGHRRQRRSVTESAGSSRGIGDDGLFVVEAPKDLPEESEGVGLGLGLSRMESRGSRGSGGTGVSGKGSREEIVFPGLEGVGDGANGGNEDKSQGT